MLIDRLVRAAREFRGPAVWLAAAALFLAALAARFALADVLAGYPFMLFYPAVALAAFLGGRGPACALAVASAAAAWWLLIRAPGMWFPQTPADLAALAGFLFVSGLIAVLIDALRTASGRLRAESVRTARLLETQRTMFHELQHRVANNMQFVASLIGLQARRLRDADDAREALTQAVRRLETLARVHRRLYDPANAARDFGRTVEEICRDLLAVADARNVVCLVDMRPVDLGMDRLTAISLIVTELLTNALKHAFAGGRGGTMTIGLNPVGQGRYLLEVRDDGPGLPEDFDAESESGDHLGLRIIQSLARRLDGTLTISADGGTVTRIEFAA